MPEVLLMRATYASEPDARAAATMLVEKRLVTCSQVQKVWSTYRWKGKVEAADEWQMEVKLQSADLDLVWGMVLDRHPYENPCVEVVGAAQVPAPYMRWVERVTKR